MNAKWCKHFLPCGFTGYPVLMTPYDRYGTRFSVCYAAPDWTCCPVCGRKLPVERKLKRKGEPPVNPAEEKKP